MSDESAAGPKAEFDPDALARGLMPPLGSIKQQVDMQLAFLTQAMIDGAVLAKGLFDDPEPNAVAETWPPRRGSQPAASRWRVHRSAELQDMARIAASSARLIAAYARLDGQFHQNFTIHHIQKVEDDGVRKRRTTITETSGNFPSMPRDAAEGIVDTPPPSESGGSNASD